MKEWLLLVFKAFTFVTVRHADAPRGQRAMHSLSLQQTSFVGKSWDLRSSPDHRLTVRVQLFEDYGRRHPRADGTGSVRNEESMEG